MKNLIVMMLLGLVSVSVNAADKTECLFLEEVHNKATEKGVTPQEYVWYSVVCKAGKQPAYYDHASCVEKWHRNNIVNKIFHRTNFSHTFADCKAGVLKINVTQYKADHGGGVLVQHDEKGELTIKGPNDKNEIEKYKAWIAEADKNKK